MPIATSARRLAAPRTLKKSHVAYNSVTLTWAAPKGAQKPKKYAILRNGKKIGETKSRKFVDRKVAAGKTYRYNVVGVDAHKKNGALSKTLRVVVPKKPVKTPTTPGTGTPVSTLPPVVPYVPPVDPPIVPPDMPVTSPLTTAMVDRLFWRAGFGPSAADRTKWTGRPANELVNWFLDTKPTLVATNTPPLALGGAPIDPLLHDDQLVMSWLDSMQRSDNPFPERLAFFWHRHWAITRDVGIDTPWVLQYLAHMRQFADLPGNPNLSFRDIAVTMTTKDGAMSWFLNGDINVDTAPNENYAREFMELFCLGTTAIDGTPNYKQEDVRELARAFTGWQLQHDPNIPATYGDVTFDASYHDAGSKKILGQTAAFTTQQAIDLVLSQSSHAPFLIRKLWGEFIAGPIPQATLNDLVAKYTAGGALKLRPVLYGILTHPLMFDSIDEPNMVKPPVVYTVGVLRQMDGAMMAYWIPEALDGMQQRPFSPPNVAGWEGGLSWLNSNTVQARFDLLVRVQYIKHKGGGGGDSYPGGAPPADIQNETAAQVYDRAYASVKSPWLSDGTKASLRAWVNAAPSSNAAERRQRYYTLQALMLGGPDGQVM